MPYFRADQDSQVAEPSSDFWSRREQTAANASGRAFNLAQPSIRRRPTKNTEALVAGTHELFVY